MSAPPVSQRLTREDLPGSPDWVDTLLMSLNPFEAATTLALTRGLTFADNVSAQVMTVDVVAPSPVWTEVADQGKPAPSFLNSWVNYDAAAFNTAAFRVDASGHVLLRGLVKSGTIGTSVFVLPEGYRPAVDVGFATDSSSAFGAGRVTKAGAVQANVGNNAWFFLDGISFDAAPRCAAPVRWTGSGWPIPLKVSLPGVSWVLTTRAIDLDAPSGTKTTLAAGAVPEWTMGSDGRLLVQAVPGLTPGRNYRLSFLLLAG